MPFIVQSEMAFRLQYVLSRFPQLTKACVCVIIQSMRKSAHFPLFCSASPEQERAGIAAEGWAHPVQPDFIPEDQTDDAARF
ncbi:MAG: hypothetical protein IKI77_06805 [Oscillospiraceae bacterium]|nr:hypothetical protein [Oscillospiraceae bacterium]